MLTSAIRAQRPAAPQTIQEITAQATPGQIAQITTGQIARTHVQATTVATLTPAQIAVAAAAQQRLPGTTTVAGSRFLFYRN